MGAFFGIMARVLSKLIKAILGFLDKKVNEKESK